MRTLRRRLAGLVFIVLLAAAVTASIGTYAKWFTPAIWVSLHANHTGMQLNEGAEVRLRGVQVGEVRRISADGEKAQLAIALDPETAGDIPSNVTARLLPKTLFGEKYVALAAPASGAAPHAIEAGAIITQDRTETAIELERVLDGVLPVLKAVPPDKLAATLTAVARALEGRGDRIGNNLVSLEKYLKALNAEMPTIKADITKLADTLDVYSGALPDLLTMLRNLTVTGTTISEQRTQIASFFASATDLADSTRYFLDRHDDRLIQVGKVSRPLLETLAAYAPEYPCFLRGARVLQPRVEETFATGRLHITLEVTRDNGKFLPGRDEPEYGTNHGPDCRYLPRPPVPAPQIPLGDGYDYTYPRSSLTGGLPEVINPKDPKPQGKAVSTFLLDPTMGYAGTPEERALIRPIVAASTGRSVADIGDMATLLWAPLLRGGTVSES